MKHTELIERLRGVVQKLRRTPMPIADIAPMTNEAADAIESLQAEVERLNSQQVPDWFKEQVMAVQAERDALKLDAERYCVLRDSKYQLGEDDISVSDSSFNVFFEQDLDKAVDALRHRYEAVKGAA